MASYDPVYLQSKMDLAVVPPKEFTFVHSSPGSRVFMAPNTEFFQGQTADRELRTDEFEDVKVGRRSFFIFVRVSYTDHIDKARIQEFCVYYVIASDTFSYCHEHNEVK